MAEGQVPAPTQAGTHTHGAALATGGAMVRAQTLGRTHGQALLAAIIRRIRDEQAEHDKALTHDLGAR